VESTEPATTVDYIDDNVPEQTEEVNRKPKKSKHSFF